MVGRTASIVGTVILGAILTSCSNANRTPVGYLIDVAIAPEHCGDGRWIVITATGNHRAIINGDPNRETPIAQTVSTVRETLRYRAEKIIYVDAEPTVPWSDFIDVLDAIRPEAEIVSLVTPRTKALAEKRWCLAPSCGRCDRLRSFVPHH